MKAIKIFLLFFCFLITGRSSVLAMGDDDPLLTMFKLDHLEYAFKDENPLKWKGSFWLGKDLNKFYLKTEGELIDSNTEGVNVELLYSKAVDPYWDVQLGLKREQDAIVNKDFFAIGFHGLAPYFFEIDTTLYVADSGLVELAVEAEYEMMLTQQWVLSPDIELKAYSESEPFDGIGSGLSEVEFGITLSYQITRQVAPYIGWRWEKKFGQTADFATLDHGSDKESIWVAGISFWF